VRAGDRYDDAQQSLRDHGAYDVETRDRSAIATGKPLLQTSPDTREVNSTAGDSTLQLREEELVAHKQQVETGQVQIRTDVVTEERTLEVPVTHEEVTIQRTAVDHRPADRAIDDRGESIQVPVREERVELEKRPVVYEEVALGTREVQDTQHVSGTVRREEAHIENQGNVKDAVRETRDN
jgi:uncharacterized protein (TIGR02271 family)